MSSLNDALTGKTYWRSLDEYADTPEFRRFVESEFPSSMPEFLTAPTRRRFLQLMGASMALAGLTGCRWPQEKIMPYAARPKGRVPGTPERYATAMELGGVASGLLVTSYDGRPIKIEGNPTHPMSLGATDAFAQASVLELYDPDRFKAAIEVQGGRPFGRKRHQVDDFLAKHFNGLRATHGKGVCVLSEASSSPSLADMRSRFLRMFPEATWYEYEPLSRDNEREGSRLAYGRVLRTHLAMNEADVIVALDADPLGTHPAAVRYTRDWAEGRDVGPNGRRRDNGRPMSRMYAFERVFSLTGSVADHRVGMSASGVRDVLWMIVSALAERSIRFPGLVAPERVEDKVIQAAARDLVGASGRGLIVVGERQPPEVHALAHFLNGAMQNTGRTVFYTEETDAKRPTHVEAISTLAQRMAAGEVDTLLMIGGNPVYDAPADVGFAEAVKKVGTSIHLSLFENETTKACTWRLPRAHYLESWGDARSYDGTLSIVQPLIAPLYGEGSNYDSAMSAIELLARVVGDSAIKGYDIVRRTMKEQYTGIDFEKQWLRWLNDGVVPDSAFARVTPNAQRGKQVEDFLRNPALTKRSGLEIVFDRDSHTYDGRFANNGWMQETPDSLTKLTWDNAAIIGPALAKEHNLTRGDLVTLSVGDRSLTLPVFVLPGQPRNTIKLTLGYGRTSAGRVGDKTGFNVYTLRTTDAMYQSGAAEVMLAKASGSYPLSVTQDHHAVQSKKGDEATQERLPELIHEATVGEYVKNPRFIREGVHRPPLISLWEEPKPQADHRWAMSIDLNKCTGCNACVVACQSENNIPIVGKDEVDRGREMQWIRIDRYFKGQTESPEVRHQPLTCHQCENAPCEQVCPVGATMHSDEGLNDMVYNRCIGTRYCSNNCPYKVRRFNWFNNHRNLEEVEKMVFNPEVTVRSRGVMEKCTYCVQRINLVKIAAKNDGRPIADGEIVPACEQVCPAQAIVFGDLNDKNSRVSQAHEDSRSYAMLEELNVKPRMKYLAKLNNPSSALQQEKPEAHGGHNEQSHTAESHHG